PVRLCACFSFLLAPPPTSTLFPYTTLFRSAGDVELNRPLADLRLVELAPATARRVDHELHLAAFHAVEDVRRALSDLSDRGDVQDRKSTRLNSSHVKISYAVFCLKKKNTKH